MFTKRLFLIYANGNNDKCNKSQETGNPISRFSLWTRNEQEFLEFFSNISTSTNFKTQILHSLFIKEMKFIYVHFINITII